MAVKIIRLTESDLTTLVKRVINEQSSTPFKIGDLLSIGNDSAFSGPLSAFIGKITKITPNAKQGGFDIIANGEGTGYASGVKGCVQVNSKLKKIEGSGSSWSVTDKIFGSTDISKYNC